MESEMIEQEPLLDGYRENESEKEKDIGIKRVFDLKRPNLVSLLGELTRQTKKQAILGSMITNYIMHLR